MRNQTFTLVLCIAALGCNDDASNASVTRASATQGYVDPAGPSCTPGEIGEESPSATGHALSLWPPNHKLHAISTSDCATAFDACGDELRGEFIWGSSDEPINDIGDGNHEPDILFDDCQRVSVRSERQGPKDGRVYKLGVRFIDVAGNETDTECTIIVDHDQRGVVGADSGEAYRVTLDGTGGLPECDGIEPPPPNEPDASVPPAPDASEPEPEEDAGDVTPPD